MVSNRYRENVNRAAPTMRRVYENTFGVSLKSRVSELIERYPDVADPNWISWEGHSITNISTSEKLRILRDAL